MVSAPVIAKERDIAVTEANRENCGSFQSMIKVTITTEAQTRAVAGTLFGVDRPRIVEIRDIPIDAELGPHMLYIVNEDRPGFIGALGTTLGDAGINIATFHLGRSAPGGDAISLIEVDGDVGEDVVNTVKALPQVKRAAALVF